MEISELSIEEKVAQLFMVGIHDKDTDGIIDLIKNEKIGGVVLYGNNFDNYKEMVNLVNRLKQVNSENPIPLCISIDQEGGRVNRMPDEILNIQSEPSLLLLLICTEQQNPDFYLLIRLI